MQQSTTFYTTNHIIKGQYAETLVANYFKELGYFVLPHKVTSGGPDLVAFNSTKKVIGEVLNWYGGYPHPRRFESILKNLLDPNIASSKHGLKIDRVFFCWGVKPTTYQSRLLKAYGIQLITLEPGQPIPRGVITYTSNTTSFQTYTSYSSDWALFLIINDCLRSFRMKNCSFEPILSNDFMDGDENGIAS